MGTVSAVVLLAVVAYSPRCATAQVREKLERADSLYAAFNNRAALTLYEELYLSEPWEPPAAAGAPTSTDFQLLYRLSRTAGDVAKDVLAAGGRAEALPIMERSVAYAERLKALHPDRPETWFQLAVTWGTLARTEDGRERVKLGRDVEEYAQKAIALDPSYAYAHLALGIFYREVGDLNWIQRTFANTFYGGLPDGGAEMALKSLRAALERDPSLVMTHYELAVTYLMTDNTPKAQYHLERAIELAPINTEEIRQQAEAARLLDEIEENRE